MQESVRICPLPVCGMDLLAPFCASRVACLPALPLLPLLPFTAVPAHDVVVVACPVLSKLSCCFRSVAVMRHVLCRWRRVNCDHMLSRRKRHPLLSFSDPPLLASPPGLLSPSSARPSPKPCFGPLPAITSPSLVQAIFPATEGCAIILPI